MIWSLADRLSLPLYFRSPIARDKLRLPLTLQQRCSACDGTWQSTDANVVISGTCSHQGAPDHTPNV